MVQLQVGTVKRVAADVLEAAGAPRDIAEQVSGWLTTSDQSGHPSHGVIRLMDYVGRIERGVLNPTGRPQARAAEGGDSVVLIDGNKGFGLLAANLLTELLIERTRVHPVTMGGIVNASHTGRLGEWAELAARNDISLFICTASLGNQNVAGYGAKEARLGTNPIAWSFPADAGDSFLMDYATSEIAGGKIQHLLSVGGQTPPNSLVDRDGNPTTDPQAWLDGGSLLTFGAHKGYGLSLLISLLAACLVRDAAPEGSHGVLAIAINIGAFAPADRVRASVKAELNRMRDTPPRPGFDRVQVPGDFERENRASQINEVEIAPATWQSILDLGEKLGVPMSQI